MLRPFLRFRPNSSQDVAANPPLFHLFRSLCLLGTVVLMLGCASPGPAVPGTTVSTTERQITATTTPRILVTVTTPPPRGVPAAGSNGGEYGPSGAYTVSKRVRQTVARIARDHGLAEVDGWPIRTLGIYCAVFATPEGKPLDDLLAELRRDRRVEAAQRMQEFEVLGSEPEDSGSAGPDNDGPRLNRPLTPHSEDHSTTGDPYAEMQHGLAEMGVWQVHARADGSGVKVAVIDTGVDTAHPDLARSLGKARDFVGGFDPVPPEAHGTAIAGIIGSTPNNGIGTVGVAPGAKILALRACSERGGSGVCDSFTLAKALAFAIDERSDFVNLSLTGPSDPLLERLVLRALERGVGVIAASRGKGEEVGFPASVPGVIRVSGAGPAHLDPGGRALLRAPGSEVLATRPGGGFDFVTGSSFAAAHVSGVLALLRQRAPRLDADELAEVLRATSRPDSEYPLESLIDACGALERVDRTFQCSRPEQEANVE